MHVQHRAVNRTSDSVGRTVSASVALTAVRHNIFMTDNCEKAQHAAMPSSKCIPHDKLVYLGIQEYQPCKRNRAASRCRVYYPRSSQRKSRDRNEAQLCEDMTTLCKVFSRHSSAGARRENEYPDFVRCAMFPNNHDSPWASCELSMLALSNTAYYLTRHVCMVCSPVLDVGQKREL